VQLVADVYGYYQRLPPAGRAVAVVTRTGAVGFDAARTRNFSAVTRIATGIYCLTPGGVAGIHAINPATTPVYVTVEWDDSLGFALAAYHTKGTFSGCTKSQITVRTYDFASNPSDDVSFEVFIP
jgi:hypothetical protein